MAFEIHLFRSHFSVLAIGAADTLPRLDEPPFVGQTGWCTRFDGGRNARTPSDFIALCGEAKEDGSSVFYALVVRESWIQDPGRACRVLLRHRSGNPDLSLDGRKMVESAATFAEGREEKMSWEWVEESAVPTFVLPVLSKVITTLQGLFGQGGDFFQISLAPPEEEAPKPTTAPARRRGAFRSK